MKWALGGVSPSPFFRFPALQHPPEMVTYLGNRNIAIFSCDLDSFDFKARDAKQVIDLIFKKLDKHGKGIILMHDFHKHTAACCPNSCTGSRPKATRSSRCARRRRCKCLPQYEEALMKDVKLPTVSTRPVSSVVTKVSE